MSAEPAAATFTRQSAALVFLAALFAGSLTIAVILANKAAMIFGLAVPAGVVAYSLTFPVTDLVAEVWGKKAAGVVVAAGFAALAAAYGLIQLSLVLPAAPFYKHGEAFAQVAGSTRRIIVASLAAYLVSQTTDVFLFHGLKKLTKGRSLWLRNNLSTMVSQLIDSAIFCGVAFYGVLPLAPLILGQWVVKVVVALCDTPLVYAGRYVLGKLGIKDGGS